MLQTKSFLFLSTIPSLTSPSTMPGPSAADSIDFSSFDKDYNKDMDMQYNNAGAADTVKNTGSFDDEEFADDDAATAATEAPTNDDKIQANVDNGAGNKKSTKVATFKEAPAFEGVPNDGLLKHAETEFHVVFQDFQSSFGIMFDNFQSFHTASCQIQQAWGGVQTSALAEARRLDDVGAEIEGFTNQFEELQPSQMDDGATTNPAAAAGAAGGLKIKH